MSQLRIILGMGSIGGLVALALAAPVVLPSLAASSTVIEDVRDHTVSAVESLLPEPNPFDPATLVKVSGPAAYEIEPSVDIEPMRQSVVKKIGYGRAETITVVQTASGIYSSDALDSANVRYLGIKRIRTSRFAGLTVWNGRVWVRVNAFSAGSFATLTPFNGGTLVTTNDGQCVVTRTSIRC